MEIHQVRYFLALCESLNFTRAAETCHVSQPSLTRAIKALEDELGGALFHRERNNTHLSDLGRLMKPYLDRAWESMGKAHSKAVDYVAMADAPLAVGLMCTIGPTRLMELFSKFHEHYPGIDLHLKDGGAQELHEALDKGALDVAVYGLPDLNDQRFHQHPLFVEPFVIIVASSHPFAKLDAVRFCDLHQQRYLGRSKCEMNDRFMEVARDLGVEPLKPYLSERDRWIEAMVQAGWGFSFFPESAVTVEGLVRRPLIEPEFTRTVNLVTVRGRPHTPAVGAFVREALRHNWNETAGKATPGVAAR